jgi:hypothetical protein
MNARRTRLWFVHKVKSTFTMKTPAAFFSLNLHSLRSSVRHSRHLCACHWVVGSAICSPFAFCTTINPTIFRIATLQSWISGGYSSRKLMAINAKRDDGMAFWYVSRYTATWTFAVVTNFTITKPASSTIQAKTRFVIELSNALSPSIGLANEE